MARRLKIAGMGSCRIYDPLKRFAPDALFEVCPVLSGHIHNPLEVVQMLRFRRGALAVPTALASLMNILNPARLERVERRVAELRRLDIAMVELSSIRLVELDGWQLQINAVRDALQRAGASDAQARMVSLGEKREAWGDWLAPDLGEPLRSLVANGRFREMEADEIAGALAEIRSEIGRPMMLVGTVERLPNGDLIAQRATLNAALRDIAASADDVAFFDPTRFVGEHPFEEVLADMGHYRKAFLPVAAGTLQAETSRFAMRLGLTASA